MAGRRNKKPARMAVRWDLPAIVLLLSNAVTIVLAVSQRWGVIDLVVTYWAQSVTIGFFNWKRMRALEDQAGRSDRGSRRETSGFFALHYGMFHFVYLVFLLIGVIAWGLDSPWIIVGIAAFVVNHALSYRFKMADDRAGKVDIDKLFFFPYARIIPMHLTIILGAFVSFYLTPDNQAVLLFFLILKTVADMIMHFVERSLVSDKPIEGD